jgi:glycosyltransferase involved in cell wall biosynthesis
MVAASPFPYPQGSQVLIGQLAAALQRRGHSVQVVTYHTGVGQDPEDLEIHRMPALPGMDRVRAGPSWRKPVLDLVLLRELRRIVRDWRPDVIHTHNFEGLLAALPVRRLTGVPVVHHIHNAMGLELHTYFPSRFGRWLGASVGQWIDGSLTKKADQCIVLNEDALSYFARLGLARVRFVPPGIDFEPGQAQQARQRLGKGPLIAYSGNLDPYQDLEVLLDAFRLVADASPDAKLVLSTSAALGEWRVRAGVLGLGKQVVFDRAKDFEQVRDLLALADVAVCPRQTCLGFPIKLLNYMAAGRAIVVAEGSACGLGHLKEAWVVENGSSAGMAAAILALLDRPSLARRLGERARRRAEREHSWARIAVDIEKVYEDTTQSGRLL